MTIDPLSLMTAERGTFVVNDTTEVVMNAAAIYVLEDTVFSRIEVDGDTATDVKADYIQTVGSAVKAGALLRPIAEEADTRFSAVTLTSGSVVLIIG